MLSLLPSKQQWKSWSKPTKYEFIGLIVALLALFSVPERVGQFLEKPLAEDYDKLRTTMINKLQAASACLSARLYYDGLHHLDSDCRLDVQGLSRFAHAFAPYMATVPYSGAWNIEDYAKRVEADTEAINRARTRDDLIIVQRRIGSSLALTGYYMCGIEWYLRAGPPEEVGQMNKGRVKIYQDSWLSWVNETGGDFGYASFEHTKYEIRNDPDCSSFIDLLD